MDWHHTFRDDPISVQTVKAHGSTPRGAINRVVKFRSAMESMIHERVGSISIFPDEIVEPSRYLEGASRRVWVNAYERSGEARRRCLAAHGTSCHICDYNFEAVFGPEAIGYIHVHHLRPLSEIGGEYVVDPINDLRPVCPNCHAFLHMNGRCRTIDEVRAILAGRLRTGNSSGLKGTFCQPRVKP